MTEGVIIQNELLSDWHEWLLVVHCCRVILQTQTMMMQSSSSEWVSEWWRDNETEVVVVVVSGGSEEDHQCIGGDDADGSEMWVYRHTWDTRSWKGRECERVGSQCTVVDRGRTWKAWFLCWEQTLGHGCDSGGFYTPHTQTTLGAMGGNGC